MQWQQALAALILLSQKTSIITATMLKAGIFILYKDQRLEEALALLERLEKEN